MIDTIFVLIVGILFFWTGYYLGTKRSSKEDAKAGFEKLMYQGKNVMDDVKPGVIKRPSAQDLAFKNQDPVAKAGEEAVLKSIEENPELVEMQRRAKLLRKEGKL